MLALVLCLGQLSDDLSLSLSLCEQTMDLALPQFRLLFELFPATIAMLPQHIPSILLQHPSELLVLALSSMAPELVRFLMLFGSGLQKAVILIIFLFSFIFPVRTITGTTFANSFFSYYFNPSSSEAGRYSISGHHPSAPKTTEEDSFTLVGLRFSSSSVSLSGVPNNLLTSNGQIKLINMADIPIHGISLAIYGRDSKLYYVDVNAPTSLGPNENFPLVISVNSTSEWYGTIGTCCFSCLSYC
jgi:hypothetical protein